MNIKEFQIFSSNIKSKLEFDYSIKKLNWFNIGGITKVFFKADSLNDLILFLKKFGKYMRHWSRFKYINNR